MPSSAIRRAASWAMRSRIWARWVVRSLGMVRMGTQSGGWRPLSEQLALDFFEEFPHPAALLRRGRVFLVEIFHHPLLVFGDARALLRVDLQADDAVRDGIGFFRDSLQHFPHVAHPDRQRCLGAGFAAAERVGLVESDPGD